MPPALPRPMAAYLKANSTFDVEGMLAAFAADAAVVDEKRTHRGHAEIRAWIEEATVGSKAIAVPGPVTVDGRDFVFPAQVSGEFPTSPVTLTFRCRIADDHIAFLEIV